MKNSYDVIVVGTGNAALSAALSASDNGAKKILVIEKASKKKEVEIADIRMELFALLTKAIPI